jgi:hypothetical protein
VLAFRDVNPQAPTHVLVIPRAHHANVAALAAADPAAALRAVGVRWVVVEKGMATVERPEGHVVHEGDDLALIGLAAADPPVAVGSDRDIGSGTFVLIVTGHAATAVLLLLGGGVRIRGGRDLRHSY